MQPIKQPQRAGDNDLHGWRKQTHPFYHDNDTDEGWFFGVSWSDTRFDADIKKENNCRDADAQNEKLGQWPKRRLGEIQNAPPES